jgi:hypothetical protein
MVTVAPTIAAPISSVTLPLKVAVDDWVNTVIARVAISNANPIIFLNIVLLPLFEYFEFI